MPGALQQLLCTMAYRQGGRDLDAIRDESRLFDELSEEEQTTVLRMWAILVPYGVEKVHVARLLSLLQVRA